ncbi:MAG TPA: hypothetical protein VJI98_02855 [Candidatus Nanoarchaeia archaeon]|nr:hypothetical protein [Candidatus Nanoarchaeia archaeon]
MKKLLVDNIRKSEMWSKMADISPISALKIFDKRLEEKQALAKEMVRDHILFWEKDKIIRLFRLYT